MLKPRQYRNTCSHETTHISNISKPFKVIDGELKYLINREIIKGTTPFVKTEFYSWLKEQEKPFTHYTEAIKIYFELDLMGIKKRPDLRAHKYTFEFYTREHININNN